MAAHVNGARIALLRRMRGMTQQNFADALGVSRGLVARWETGRGGETPYLEQIAAALAVPVEAFLTGMSSRSFQETLTIDERRLLGLYRSGTPTERLMMLHEVVRVRMRSAPPAAAGAA